MMIDDLLCGKVEVSVQDAIQCHTIDSFGEHVVFVDGSWWMPTPGGKKRSARADFIRGPRIAGARFFDMDDISLQKDENEKQLPHMMPRGLLFAAAMDRLQISNKHHVIIHAQTSTCPTGLHRTWYEMYCMGHDINRLHLLQGAVLEDWIPAGGPVDNRDLTTTTTDTISSSGGDNDHDNLLFWAKDLNLDATPRYQALDTARNVVDLDEVLQIIHGSSSSSSSNSGNNNNNSLIVDVRSPDRFYGRVDEPRPGLKRGHMPGAKNVFFASLLQGPDQLVQLKSVKEIKTILSNALGDSVVNNIMNDDTNQNNGLSPSRTRTRIVATCGTGVTACTLAVALHKCGYDPSQVAIYDGSWTEYGAESKDVPIVLED
jgi:thiosulfate/3-mercaptopyruvate sulfurtransferase